ncbi:MAG: Histidine-tRNA ligase [Parcubacteria group bacterium GW2011_GWA2_47_7]|nr:MAG: Histidine-tRNA ligase [Parcubacteria group bacterium GW2011_GWA2_47_7]
MTKKETDKKIAPTALKGMRDLIGDESHKYQGFFEKAAEVALYYGFQPIDVPIMEREEVFLSTQSEDTDLVEKEMYAMKTKGGDKIALRPEGTAPVMRAYLEHGMMSHPQPVKFYYYGSFFRHDNPQRGRYRDFRQFGIEMIGSSKSISDALVIYLNVMILKEVGLSNIMIDVNSIGDKESRAPYLRELTTYYRKHINHLCANCKQRIKTNPLRLLDCKSPECQIYKEKAPQSIAHLSPAAKQHFKEVLEFLDALKLTYRINTNLVRGLDYYTHTVFEITEIPDDRPAEIFAENATQLEATDKEKDDKKKKHEREDEANMPMSIAGGGRYDYLAKRLGSKKDIPAVGSSIGVDRVLMSPNYKGVAPRIVKKPKIFFIQLGFEAKLKSLEIIEVLRAARIPVTHSLNKDSLGTQLGIAERMQVPFSLIFGQKEALEGTVIVRNMLTRSQETIKIAKLADYIKAIK